MTHTGLESGCQGRTEVPAGVQDGLTQPCREQERLQRAVDVLGDCSADPALPFGARQQSVALSLQGFLQGLEDGQCLNPRLSIHKQGGNFGSRIERHIPAAVLFASIEADRCVGERKLFEPKADLQAVGCT